MPPIPWSETSIEQQEVLAFVPKVTSFCSILGSCYILLDILRLKREQRNTYHRILWGMNLMDLCAVVAWFFTTWPMPTDTQMAGASGNQVTCSAQGFFSQLGISTVLYNACLALYFMMVICWQWTERKIAQVKLEYYIHIICIGVGVGTAAIGLGLELYNPTGWQCWMAPAPVGCTESYQRTEQSTDNNNDNLNLGEAADFETRFLEVVSPTSTVTIINTTDDGETIIPCERGDNANLYAWFLFYIPLWICIAVATCSLYQVYATYHEQELIVEKWRQKLLTVAQPSIKVIRKTTSAGLNAISTHTRSKRRLTSPSNHSVNQNNFDNGSEHTRMETARSEKDAGELAKTKQSLHQTTASTAATNESDHNHPQNTQTATPHMVKRRVPNRNVSFEHDASTTNHSQSQSQYSESMQNDSSNSHYASNHTRRQRSPSMDQSGQSASSYSTTMRRKRTSSHSPIPTNSRRRPSSHSPMRNSRHHHQSPLLGNDSERSSASHRHRRQRARPSPSPIRNSTGTRTTRQSSHSPNRNRRHSSHSPMRDSSNNRHSAHSPTRNSTNSRMASKSPARDSTNSRMASRSPIRDSTNTRHASRSPLRNSTNNDHQTSSLPLPNSSNGHQSSASPPSNFAEKRSSPQSTSLRNSRRKGLPPILGAHPQHLRQQRQHGSSISSSSRQQQVRMSSSSAASQRSHQQRQSQGQVRTSTFSHNSRASHHAITPAATMPTALQIHQQIALQKRPQRRPKSAKAKMVTSQALLYLLSFYIAWLFPTITRIQQVTSEDGIAYYHWMLLSSIFVPLQGLINFIVYIRPKVLQIRREKKRQAALKEQYERRRKEWQELMEEQEHLEQTDQEQQQLVPPLTSSSHHLRSQRPLNGSMHRQRPPSQLLEEIKRRRETDPFDPLLSSLGTIHSEGSHLFKSTQTMTESDDKDTADEDQTEQAGNVHDADGVYVVSSKIAKGSNERTIPGGSQLPLGVSETQHTTGEYSFASVPSFQGETDEEYSCGDRENRESADYDNEVGSAKGENDIQLKYLQTRSELSSHAKSDRDEVTSDVYDVLTNESGRSEHSSRKNISAPPLTHLQRSNSSTFDLLSMRSSNELQVDNDVMQAFHQSVEYGSDGHVLYRNKGLNEAKLEAAKGVLDSPVAMKAAGHSSIWERLRSSGSSFGSTSLGDNAAIQQLQQAEHQDALCWGNSTHTAPGGSIYVHNGIPVDSGNLLQSSSFHVPPASAKTPMPPRGIGRRRPGRAVATPGALTASTGSAQSNASADLRRFRRNAHRNSRAGDASVLRFPTKKPRIHRSVTDPGYNSDLQGSSVASHDFGDGSTVGGLSLTDEPEANTSTPEDRSKDKKTSDKRSSRQASRRNLMKQTKDKWASKRIVKGGMKKFKSIRKFAKDFREALTADTVDDWATADQSSFFNQRSERRSDSQYDHDENAVYRDGELYHDAENHLHSDELQYDDYVHYQDNSNFNDHDPYHDAGFDFIQWRRVRHPTSTAREEEKEEIVAIPEGPY